MTMNDRDTQNENYSGFSKTAIIVKRFETGSNKKNSISRPTFIIQGIPTKS